jgi:hypothetical protein
VKYRMRVLEERDVPALKAMQARKRERLGRDFEEVDSDRCAVMVAEDGAGAIVGFVALVPAVELVMIGDDPRIVRAAMKHKYPLHAIARRRGAKVAFTFLPEELLREERKSGMQAAAERGGFELVQQRAFVTEILEVGNGA